MCFLDGMKGVLGCDNSGRLLTNMDYPFKPLDRWSRRANQAGRENRAVMCRQHTHACYCLVLGQAMYSFASYYIGLHNTCNNRTLEQWKHRPIVLYIPFMSAISQDNDHRTFQFKPALSRCRPGQSVSSVPFLLLYIPPLISYLLHIVNGQELYSSYSFGLMLISHP